jgi:diguanylate cyclase (GGDEF)-like protein
VSASAVADRYGRVTGCVAILRDITGRKRSEEELRYMATHDPLTKLPNRTLFGDRAAQAMARARRYRHFVGVMMVDLDRFKQVNDTLGHETGDRLLKAVAARLRSLVRDSDTVARLGGDEFVVLATDLPAPETASIVADRLIDALSRPVPVGDRSIDVSASIGASVFPGDGETFDELPARSDVALYRAKENRGTVAFHSAV